MEFINLLLTFLTLPTLVGIVILSRHISKTWQVILGTVLVILGLLFK